MVVIVSCLYVVCYKMVFDKYINEMGYDDLKIVVVFFGIVKDGEIYYIELEMN